MGQSGVSAVPSGMMVGRPGSQPGAGGQGPMGNPQSKRQKLIFYRYFFSIVMSIFAWTRRLYN